MTQVQKGGDGSTNLQAGGDINLTLMVQAGEKDFGIISEIFEHAVDQAAEHPPLEDATHLDLNKKIELNFHTDDEKARIREYFKLAYSKVAAIQRRIEMAKPEAQNDLQGHVLSRYFTAKDEGLTNMQILEKLFREFTLPDKAQNPTYSNLTRAFVLFFFDDCTIFEKTEEERAHH